MSSYGYDSVVLKRIREQLRGAKGDAGTKNSYKYTITAKQRTELLKVLGQAIHTEEGHEMPSEMEKELLRAGLLTDADT